MGFPSLSMVSRFLPVSLHYANVSLGNPSLCLDTGSDLFWIPCDCQKNICVRALQSSSGAITKIGWSHPQGLLSTSGTTAYYIHIPKLLFCRLGRESLIYAEMTAFVILIIS
nr:uncharacterized protein LOC111998376 [Quercus suber]